MYGIDVLIQKVMLITAMVICGAVLRKYKILKSQHAKGFADTIVYLAQPAMIIYSFLEAEFNAEILITSLCVFMFSMLFHLMFFWIAILFFKNASENHKAVLQFSTVFTNAGFMGIPLISELISPVAAIYATFYVVAFNIFCWSLGCYIFSGDKQYISVKKMLINPATIPTYIGLLFFVLGGVITIPNSLKPFFDDFLTPIIKDNILFSLKSIVIPLSMMMVGIRLAETKITTLIRSHNFPKLFFVRLILIPIIIMIIMKLISFTNLIPETILIPTATVIIISSSTPVAAMTSIFAERFGKGEKYASKIVSATTIMSLITMPIISAILLEVF